MVRLAASTTIVAVTASLAVTAAVTPASAGTATFGPADALRHQIVEGRGVTMSEVTTNIREDGERTAFRKKIRAEFGKGTVAALDVLDVADDRVPKPAPRFITIDGRTFCQGWLCPAPEGKSWVVLSESKKIRPFLESGGIDLVRPATLKAVLATAEAKNAGGVYDSTRTTIYQGTLTLGELYKISPAYRDQYSFTGKGPKGKEAKREVSWRIWLGKDQLVRRVWTTRTGPLGTDNGAKRWKTTITDARLTGWGAKMDIAIPSDEETASSDS